MTAIFFLLTFFTWKTVESYSSYILDSKNASYEICSRESPASCPSWSYCNTTGKCQCYGSNYWILCGERGDKGAIMPCYCLTFDNAHNTTEIGSCLYSCKFRNRAFFQPNPLYITLPKNITQVNRGMCGSHSRAGTLCGKCANYTYPQAYSYNMTCVPCDDNNWNIFKYAISAFFPLTLFYILVLLCSMNVHTSRLQGFVLYSQVISFPVVARVFVLSASKNTTEYKFFQWLQAFYGIWNLDFFRLFDHKICFKMSPLGVLSLDYLIVIYPFLLILLTYLTTVCFSDPIHLFRCCRKPACVHELECLKNWNLNNSILNAFVTFTILSCMKAFSVSIDLLIPVTIYDIHQNKSRTALFYDPSIPYFSEEHLPYAVVGIFAIMLFIVFPAILLIVYPFKNFQHCLNLLPSKWQLVIRLVLDSAQGCYKNGTELGSGDWRWYASVPYLLRLALLTLLPLSIDFAALPALLVISLVLFILLNIIMEPFKKNFRHLGTHSSLSLLHIGIYAMLMEYMYMTALKTGLRSLYYKSDASLMAHVAFVTLVVLHFIYFIFLIIPTRYKTKMCLRMN